MHAAEAIQKNHVAAGRRYPRPTETCDNCGGKLILCWGERRKIPYWRHRGGDGSRISKTPCGHVAETVTHRLAKRMLCEFLAAGGGLSVMRKCVWCHATQTIPEVIVPAVSLSSSSYPPEPPAPSSASLGDSRIDGLQIAMEVSDAEYGNCRWDVGMLEDSGTRDGSSSVVAGVEVYVTHRAVRRGMPWRTWAEIEAAPILDALDRDGLFPPVVILPDMRMCSTEKCGECAQRIRIAGELGYLLPFGQWTNRMPAELLPATKNKLWDELREHPRCIRCGEPHPLDWGFARPYCRTCYLEIMEPVQRCRMCFRTFQFLQPHDSQIPETPDSDVAILTEYGGLYAQFCLDKRRPGEEHVCRDCFGTAVQCRSCGVRLPMSRGYGGLSAPECARCAEARVRGWQGIGHCLICNQSVADDADDETKAPVRRKRCRANMSPENPVAAERTRRRQNSEDFRNGYDPLMHHMRCWRTLHPAFAAIKISRFANVPPSQQQRIWTGRRSDITLLSAPDMTGNWDRRFR